MNESLAPKRATPGEVFGRYVLYAPIARGEIATIHIARLVGAEGFSRIVAAKRLHTDLTQDPEFLKMFFDEARIASKIRHPNVVPILDIVQEDEEVILVLEYVHGVPLDRLLRAARTRALSVPADVAAAVGVGLLSGLHAAHETKDELGQPLNVVHREVAPPNVLITVDGAARLLGFGTSEAAWSALVTGAIALKGKVAYAAPEQLRGDTPDRRADLFSVGIVLWEMLVGKRLHHNMGNSELFATVMNRTVPLLTKSVDRSTVSEERWSQLAALEPVLEKACRLAPAERYENAAEMLDALSKATPAGTTVDVSRWVGTLGRDYIVWRDKVLVGIEEGWRSQPSEPGSGPSSIAADVSGPRSLRAMTVPSTPPGPPSSTPPGAPPSSFRDPTTSVGGPFAAAPLPSSLEADPRVGGTRRLVFFLAAALLVTIAVVAGVLVAVLRPRAVVGEVRAAAPHAVAPEPLATAPVVMTPPAPQPTATTPPATTTPSAVAEAPPVPARPPPPPAWRPPPMRFAPPPSRTLQTQAAAAPAPAASKPDPCDPPFYFDGRKKVYKQGCL